MRLLKRVVVKQEKHYTDLLLEWHFNGRKYLVRIDPTFRNNFKHLVAKAEAFEDE